MSLRQFYDEQPRYTSDHAHAASLHDLRNINRRQHIYDYISAFPWTSLLDVGSGTAELFLELNSHGRHLYSVDLACVRLMQAKECIESSETEAKFICGDAVSLPFESKVFDAVTCSEVLEHVPNDQLAVQEMARVIRPMGALVITVPVGGSLSEVDRYWGHLRRYEPGPLIAMMLSVGFEIREYRFFNTWFWRHLIWQPAVKILAKTQAIEESDFYRSREYGALTRLLRHSLVIDRLLASIVRRKTIALFAVRTAE